MTQRKESINTDRDVVVVTDTDEGILCEMEPKARFGMMPSYWKDCFLWEPNTSFRNTFDENRMLQF